MRCGLNAKEGLEAGFEQTGDFGNEDKDSHCRDVTVLLERIRFLGDRVDALMNIHHASILVIDPQSGKIIDGNKESVTRYAGSRERLLSMSVDEINTLSRSEIAARMKQAVSNRHHFEFKHRLVNGVVQDVDVYSGPIMFDGRQALISFIHDATRRKATERKLHLLATTDPLTKCSNHRHFLSGLRREFRLARRRRAGLGFAMVDLDHFKRINDTFGHQVGDRLLRRVAGVLQKRLAGHGALGRLGGEEFGIVLSETALDRADRVLNDLRTSVRAVVVPTDLGPASCTISIGAALLSSDDSNEMSLMSRADQALYSAKAAGRDRVAVF
ncbi:sensor domain-containing diguanylate cyclase [Pleomorphomonas sp. NRK KF1]|uniref:sensor domain-containing diguanylate cyclase n=1 Tax=Pleomorphomonas sp. NRK KF1 TaxID=2943000 RepID=UPI002043F3E7|nr:sensor domain-containing diguanylate cyclase [Pleomorphomonas sp. NRK KF1]MCM5555548.1 sensor domain-containing diguanylate cyclase [Pleomorphomonas sp. NRK KF1]